MKKLATFIVVLFSIGIGFSIFLPPMEESALPTVQLPEGVASKLKPPVVISDSLSTPVALSQLRLSSSLFNSEENEQHYGLQLGLFGSLIDAEKWGQVFLQHNQAPLPASTGLAILKAQDKSRQWYVLTISPFNSLILAENYAQLLRDEAVKSQLILWPYQ